MVEAKTERSGKDGGLERSAINFWSHIPFTMDERRILEVIDSKLCTLYYKEIIQIKNVLLYTWNISRKVTEQIKNLTAKI